MKAAVYDVNGPPEVLRYVDVPDPEIGPRDVLIQVEAISVEGGDVLQRRQSPPPKPGHIVGYQAAGVVVRRGPEVETIAVGARLAAFNWSGSHAALFAAPESLVYPVPDGLDIDTAATIPVTFGTADDALFEFGRLTAEEHVLVTGSTGGVGLATVQLAKRAGATVIAMARGADRTDRLTALGADHVIDYAAADLLAEVKGLTGGRGVDLVVDMVGGDQARSCLRALAPRGRYVMVGFSSGTASAFGFLDLAPRSLTLMGVMFGRDMHLPRAHGIVGRHMAAAARGELQMPIDRTFPLAAAAEAHAHVETGRPFGRVILRP